MSKTPYPVTELYAWIIDDPAGEHAILGVSIGGMTMQAVSSKRETMDRPIMVAHAELAAHHTGHTVRLHRFKLDKTLNKVEPP